MTLKCIILLIIHGPYSDNAIFHSFSLIFVPKIISNLKFYFLTNFCVYVVNLKFLPLFEVLKRGIFQNSELILTLDNTHGSAFIKRGY